MLYNLISHLDIELASQQLRRGSQITDELSEHLRASGLLPYQMLLEPLNSPLPNTVGCSVT